jgi:anti-sigma28 factor (negative regulator of flagellin synthesis)
MKIQGDSQQPVEPTPRNRPVVAPATTSDTPPSVPISSGSDHADVATSPGEISRYVQILKTMNPLDSTKVDSLKARIRDGSYTAKTSDLSGPLSDLFEAPAPVPGQQPGSQQPG